ncbi:GTPase domain-containing protein [Nocardioides panacisoli]|uniref:GTPase domain-containing protein n=1 Tax=Nocardioides panacisoli TaxID=627624 RepID=UPI001C62BBAD|nr:GTPase domain-containing protein [Nocardioides panacisoli]QYJ05129.1 GTPase domain-containing protein [Nocardioides panacisoli]
MPGPLVVVPLAVGGAVVAHRVRHRLDRKHVLVVGPRDAGKTLLFSLLTRGERALADRAHRGETLDFIRRPVRMKHLNWKVSYVDTPTDRVTDADDVRARLEGADLVVFVVDASRMADEAYRAEAGLLAMGVRLNADDHTRRVLVLTHADRIGSAEVAGQDELAEIVGDDAPDLVDLTRWRSASQVVRRVVRELL